MTPGYLESNSEQGYPTKLNNNYNAYKQEARLTSHHHQ